MDEMDEMEARTSTDMAGGREGLGAVLRAVLTGVNHRRREDLIREEGRWTDEELKAIRSTASVDLLRGVAQRAKARRTEEARRWFVSHFFEHGPEWLMAAGDGEPASVTVQRYDDLVELLPVGADLQGHEDFLLAEVVRWSPWTGRRRSVEATVTFRPAHCRCTMPSWRGQPLEAG